VIEPVIIGDCTLYCGDSLEVLPALDASSIDAVVTSPPYAKQRQYHNGDGFDWDATMDMFRRFDAASDDCQLLINLGLVHKNGECIPYWEGWRERMRSDGWRFFGWYVWDQTFGLPGDWNGRLGPSHEFVFHFNKQSRRPNKITPTKVKRTVNGTGLRRKNGKTAPRMSHHGRETQPYKIPDSVIRICREAERTIAHPAKFPVAFAQHLVEAYSADGESVLDPFMGSASTALACVRTGRKFIGVEKSPEYFAIACDRIRKAYAEMPLLQGVA
jgi:DNA modification methylase